MNNKQKINQIIELSNCDFTWFVDNVEMSDIGNLEDYLGLIEAEPNSEQAKHFIEVWKEVNNE